MREFWFIRHGQSETNIGLPSDSDQTTPLTETGIAQANYVARSSVTPPDLIVVSPYLRTRQTADPTCKKFPQIPVETWPVQEFTYLSYTQYTGTTMKDRRRLSIKYFREENPDLFLGDGGESFNQFIERVEHCFLRLKVSPHERIFLFGHGWFMRAGLWVLLRDSQSEYARASIKSRIKQLMHTSALPLGLYDLIRNKGSMRSFLLFSVAVETPNCSILKYKRNQKTGEIELSGFDVSHLPKDFRQTTLRNR